MKRRRPTIPITDARFVWVPPDHDSTAFRERQRARAAAIQHEREAEQARQRAGISTLPTRRKA